MPPEVFLELSPAAIRRRGRKTSPPHPKREKRKKISQTPRANAGGKKNWLAGKDKSRSSSSGERGEKEILIMQRPKRWEKQKEINRATPDS